MKEKLEGAVYRNESWQHVRPNSTSWTMRWSAYACGDGEGEDLQLLAAYLKDGLGWLKVPRGSALFKDLQEDLRSFCDVNGLKMLAEECEYGGGEVHEIEAADEAADDNGDGAGDGQQDVCVKLVLTYQGYLDSDDLDGRVAVDFQVATKNLHGPWPTQEEQDAAFMAALAQKMHISQQVLHENGATVQYQGQIESDDGCIEVAFSCPAGASVPEMDIAHLAALAQKVEISWLQLGHYVMAPVAVLGSNSEGAPDLFVTRVDCSLEEYDDGEHYDEAIARAEKAGFEDGVAFDANDPAWVKMSTEFNFQTLSRVLSESDDVAQEEVGALDVPR